MSLDTAPQHGAPSATRWATLSIVEQLANVGSEVDRAIRAHQRGQHDRWEHALARALELFDLTASDERWKGVRRRETLRAREEFCALFFGDSHSSAAAKHQQKYFLQFAVAARQRKAASG